MSLAADESEGEQIELRSLQTQLETTQNLVTNLIQQLFELREQVPTFEYRIFIVLAHILPSKLSMEARALLLKIPVML